MISQWIQVSGSWTARREGWSLEQWSTAVPAGNAGPGSGDCEKSTEWTSGGVQVKLCTACGGDESESSCQARHDAAVEFWQSIYPPE